MRRKAGSCRTSHAIRGRAALVICSLLWPSGCAGAPATRCRRCAPITGRKPTRRPRATPDPVARKLVTYYRLLAPGAAGRPRSRPSSRPTRTGRTRPCSRSGAPRRWRASRTDRPRSRSVGAMPCACRTRLPLRRCAHGRRRSGRAPRRGAGAQGGDGITDPAAESAFMRRFGAMCTPEEQWRRFERARLDERPRRPLARQAAGSNPPARPAAEARLALRRNDPAGACPVRRLAAGRAGGTRRSCSTTPVGSAEPGGTRRRLGLDRERQAAQSRRAGGAARPSSGTSATSSPAGCCCGRRRARLEIAALPADGAGGVADAAFLAGWIALRRLDEPERALGQFRRSPRSRRGDHPGRAPNTGSAGRWTPRAATRPPPYAGGGRVADHLYGQLRGAGAGRGRGGAAPRASATAGIPVGRARGLGFADSELSGRRSCSPPGASRAGPRRSCCCSDERRPTRPARRSTPGFAARPRAAGAGGRHRPPGRAGGGRAAGRGMAGCRSIRRRRRSSRR